MFGIASAVFAFGETHVVAVASSQSFDSDLPELQYAFDDMQRFVEVMRKTGRVPVQNISSLANPTKAQFIATIQKLQVDRGSKLIFYFSGHADAGGIHFRDAKLTRGLFHQLLGAVKVVTRIVIIDSCFSGALAEKGIRPASQFQIPQVEYDEPTGSVFLAATAGDDLAFEVPELGGSLFTNYLVSGLYGQADINGDGLVSVDEIYQYVYREVTLQNLTLPNVSQRPEFLVNLKGRGALILAEVERTTMAVQIQPDIVGQIVLALKDGLQKFRLDKPNIGPMTVRVPAGVYRVEVSDGDSYGRGELEIGKGRRVLSRSDLIWQERRDLSSQAKGKRDERLLSVMLGYHSGYQAYARGGPNLELLLGTQAAQVRYLGLRLFGGLNASRNELSYRGVHGELSAASFVVGTRVEYLPKEWNGMTVGALVGGGVGYFWQNWDRSPERKFGRESGLVFIGLGVNWVTDNGWTWGVDYRRQWTFVSERGTDDVLALGANVFGFSVLL
jgi:hypothetical protein